MVSLPSRFAQWLAQHRSDASIIAHSAFFDEGYYRKQADLSLSDDAIEHYLTEGWKLGLDPHRLFSGRMYFQLNHDVEEAGCNPLLHYEKYGKFEGRKPGRPVICTGNYYEHRFVRSLLRRIGQLRYKNEIKRNANVRILVILHMFYFSATDEICQYLKNLEPYRLKLVVTYVKDYCDPEALEKFRQFGDVEFREYDNKGYDLAPFFDILSETNLDDYDVVFKIHSKSTVRERTVYGTRFGKREWFLRLFDAIVGPSTIHTTLDVLRNDPGCGLVADGKLLAFRDPPHVRRMAGQELMRRNMPPLLDDYQFVGGTCFAASAHALEHVKALGVDPADFNRVRYGFFSLAHALEREIGSEIAHAGFRLQGTQTHRLHGMFSQRRANRLYRFNGRNIPRETGLRFSDDDLLCLDGTFYSTYSVVSIPLKDLLVRDGNYELITLGEASPTFYTKDGERWARKQSLTMFIKNHFMLRFDDRLSTAEEVPWSQAILVNGDNYVMGGHELAYELFIQGGFDSCVDVIKFWYRRAP